MALSESLFGGAISDSSDDPKTMQTGKAIQHFQGPGSFASQGRGNFTSAGKSLALRNDMISAPGRFKGLLFEGVDPSNPWGQ